MLQNILTVLLLAQPGLAFQEEFVPVEEAAAANMIGASTVTPVYFRQTQENLSTEEKKALQAFLTQVRSRGKIQSAQILSWADREYPMGNDKPSLPIQVQLADNRSENIRRFLSELDVRNVELFNMAERPTTKDEVLKTQEYTVKHAMELTGVAPKPDETGAFYDLGKGSSALVFVKLAKEK